MKYKTDRVRSKILYCIYKLFNDMNVTNNRSTNTNFEGEQASYIWGNGFNMMQKELANSYNQKYYTGNSFSEVTDVAEKYLSLLSLEDEEILRLSYGIDDGKILTRTELSLYSGLTLAIYEKKLKSAMKNFSFFARDITQEEKKLLELLTD